MTFDFREDSQHRQSVKPDSVYRVPGVPDSGWQLSWQRESGDPCHCLHCHRSHPLHHHRLISSASLQVMTKFAVQLMPQQSHHCHSCYSVLLSLFKLNFKWWQPVSHWQASLRIYEWLLILVFNVCSLVLISLLSINFCNLVMQKLYLRSSTLYCRTQVKIWLHSHYNIRLSSSVHGDYIYDAFVSYSIQVGLGSRTKS